MLVRDRYGTWHAPTVVAYENEAELQGVLEKDPTLLPGFSDRAVVVAREHSVPTGSVDLIAVDAEGRLAIVECKLKDNPEIKRKVVGQLLEYASEVWRLSYDDFDARFRRATRGPSGELGAPVEEQMRTKTADPEWRPGAFRKAVTENLEAGHFHLVFAVDEITDELKGIIEYLNAMTEPGVKVLALALEYGKEGDLEILVPHLYGEEAVREKISYERWTKERLLEAAATRFGPGVSQVLQHLIEWTEGIGGEVELGSGRSPTVKAACYVVRGASFALWRTSDGGSFSPRWPNIELCGTGTGSAARFEEALRAIDGAIDRVLPEKAAATSFQGFPLALLAEGDRVQMVERALEAILHPPA